MLTSAPTVDGKLPPNAAAWLVCRPTLQRLARTAPRVSIHNPWRYYDGQSSAPDLRELPRWESSSITESRRKTSPGSIRLSQAVTSAESGGRFRVTHRLALFLSYLNESAAFRFSSAPPMPLRRSGPGRDLRPGPDRRPAWCGSSSICVSGYTSFKRRRPRSPWRDGSGESKRSKHELSLHKRDPGRRGSSQEALLPPSERDPSRGRCSIRKSWHSSRWTMPRSPCSGLPIRR